MDRDTRKGVEHGYQSTSARTARCPGVSVGRSAIRKTSPPVLFGILAPRRAAGVYLPARSSAAYRSGTDAGLDGRGRQHAMALYDHAPRRVRSPPLELLRGRR